MFAELWLYYDEYCAECKAKGIKPKEIAEWWDELE